MRINQKLNIGRVAFRRWSRESQSRAGVTLRKRFRMAQEVTRVTAARPCSSCIATQSVNGATEKCCQSRQRQILTIKPNRRTFP